MWNPIITAGIPPLHRCVLHVDDPYPCHALTEHERTAELTRLRKRRQRDRNGPEVSRERARMHQRDREIVQRRSVYIVIISVVRVQ